MEYQTGSPPSTSDDWVEPKSGFPVDSGTNPRLHRRPDHEFQKRTGQPPLAGFCELGLPQRLDSTGGLPDESHRAPESQNGKHTNQPGKACGETL